MKKASISVTAIQDGSYLSELVLTGVNELFEGHSPVYISDDINYLYQVINSYMGSA